MFISPLQLKVRQIHCFSFNFKLHVNAVHFGEGLVRNIFNFFLNFSTSFYPYIFFYTFMNSFECILLPEIFNIGCLKERSFVSDLLLRMTRVISRPCVLSPVTSAMVHFPSRADKSSKTILCFLPRIKYWPRS